MARMQRTFHVCHRADVPAAQILVEPRAIRIAVFQFCAKEVRHIGDGLHIPIPNRTVRIRRRHWASAPHVASKQQRGAVLGYKMTGINMRSCHTRRDAEEQADRPHGYCPS